MPNGSLGGGGPACGRQDNLGSLRNKYASPWFCIPMYEVQSQHLTVGESTSASIQSNRGPERLGQASDLCQGAGLSTPSPLTGRSKDPSLRLARGTGYVNQECTQAYDLDAARDVAACNLNDILGGGFRRAAADNEAVDSLA